METLAARKRRTSLSRKPLPRERLAGLAVLAASRVSRASGVLALNSPALQPRSPRAEDAGADDSSGLKKVRLKVGGSLTRSLAARAGREDAGGKVPEASSRRIIKIKGDSLRDASTSSPSSDQKDASVSIVGRYGDKQPSEPVRKSQRALKKRVLDGDRDDGVDGSHGLKKLRISKPGQRQPQLYKDSVEDSNKKSKDSGLSHSRSNADEELAAPRSREKRKKLSLVDGSYHGGEEEIGCRRDALKNKHQEADQSVSDVRAEPLMTTRQRGKSNGDSFIEFPAGLPVAPSRKPKDKLSEVEIQAKKAEAAQRRKLQVEKAAKEAEAEAIRKILGVDSDKKKEEKRQKEREGKEKAAKSHIYLASTIKWVMGPSGTVVTFPDDVGLPSLFNTRSCSYPPPREKCAGPSCTNMYKYRDSKSKLPLCSLQCYRAVQGSSQALTC